MARYYSIDEVSECSKYGTGGPNGWGVTFWSNYFEDEASHRQLIEKFAALYPDTKAKLPDYDAGEDFVECDALWKSVPIWIYYETLLSHLWIWSEDREAVEGVRVALLPLTD